MTRNEFIATAAARLWATPEAGSVNNVVLGGVRLADALESANVAPWRDQPLDPSSCAASEYIAAWLAGYEARKPDAAAVRAYKESVQ